MVRINIVTLRGDKYTINVNNDTKIGNSVDLYYYDHSNKPIISTNTLKTIVANKINTNIKGDHFDLIMNNNALDDYKTVKDYGLCDDDNLYLVCRLGGPSNRSMLDWCTPYNNQQDVSINTQIIMKWRHYDDSKGPLDNWFNRYMLNILFGDTPYYLSFGKCYNYQTNENNDNIIQFINNMTIVVTDANTQKVIYNTKPIFDMNFDITTLPLELQYGTKYHITLNHPNEKIMQYIRYVTIHFETKNIEIVI